MGKLLIIEIQRDMLLQPRAELHRDWIEDYAQDMTSGAVFPPVVVFFDGEMHWLADGFHRVYGAEAAGLDSIEADIRSGSRRDAILHSLSANAEHGHRRTNEDKRRAVDIMLDDPKWARWPDEDIARACLVTQPFIGKRRRARLPEDDTEPDEYNGYNEPGSEPSVEQETVAETIEEAVEAETQASNDTEPFDWDAARIRNEAMEAIRALSRLPSPAEVIAAWNKSRSYGEPVETLEDAYRWLGMFLELYRIAEPIRWGNVKREEMANAAE